MIWEEIVLVGGILGFLLIWIYLPLLVGMLVNALGMVPGEQNHLSLQTKSNSKRKETKSTKMLPPMLTDTTKAMLGDEGGENVV